MVHKKQESLVVNAASHRTETTSVQSGVCFLILYTEFSFPLLTKVG